MLYRLTVVAETGTRFADFGPYVASINDAGVVAFTAAHIGGGLGVFTSEGVSVDEFDEVTSHPDIGPEGELCFYGRRGQSQGVCLVRAAEVTVLAEIGPVFKAIGPLGPTMNRESVGFRADLVDGSSGMFVGSSSGVTTVALTGEEFSGFQGLPVVEPDGQVVFRADLADGRQGIYRGSAALVLTGDRFSELGRFPSSNGATVVFAGTGDGGSGIFAVRAGEIEVLYGGEFGSYRGALIDSAGRVTFFATPFGGELGIYSGTERILGLGDHFDNSVVEDFALNPVSINGSGQLAIRVKVADGRQFVVRTDP